MKKLLSLLAALTIFSLVFTGCDWQMPWDDAEDLDGDETEDVVDLDDDEEEGDDEDSDDDDTGKNMISFLDEPEEVDASGFLGDGKKVELYKSVQNNMDLDELEDWLKPTVYRVGTFASGKYEGLDVFVLLHQWEGPAPTSLFRVVVEEDEWTLLSRYSGDWGEWVIENHGDLFDHRDNMVISDYELPDVVTDAETNMSFESFGAYRSTTLVSGMLKKDLFSDSDVGSLYQTNDDRGCFFARLPDGFPMYYNPLIALYTGEGNINNVGYTSGEKVNVTWEDGAEASEYYTHHGLYGMLGGQCNMIVNNEINMDAIAQSGQTVDGDPVYEFEYENDVRYKDFYNKKFQYMDETSDEYITLDEFKADHPLFFWVDPYDNLYRFEAAKHQPPAEIGKPVIYLYPERQTLTSVKVAPTHGITVSDPPYNEGWEVLAETNGDLTNLADGLTYPYLFWEGVSLDYEMPEQGFVVEAPAVKSFLIEKLNHLGLVENEIDDFLEFWYPKFTGAPYFYVTFMPQADFDAIAPLTIYPKPDTVIRVYMDFVPLMNRIDVTEPVLERGVRMGYTAIEWGGALHK